MKKRYFLSIMIVSTLIFLMLVFVPQPFAEIAARFPQKAKASIYCRKTTLSAQNMSNGFLAECDLPHLAEALSLCEDVDGISVKFLGNESDFNALLSAFRVKIFDFQRFDKTVVVCGCSPCISGGVNLGGKIVNIQLAFDGVEITVGSPLIFDSF